MQFAFCPICAAPLKAQTLGMELVPTCTNPDCGFRLFPAAKPCATLVIENAQGQVLMGRRARDPDAGKLDLIGGFIGPDELPATAARREAREELSVDVRLTDLLGFAIDTYVYQGITSNTLNIAFLAELERPDIVAADDVASLVWVDPATVSRSELAFSNNEVFLDKLLQRRRGAPTLLE